MKRRSFLKSTTLSLAGGIAALSAVGCQWLTANAPLILAAIQDAVIVVEQIEAWVQSYFQAHPNPEKQASIVKALAKVRDAIDAAAKLLAGGLAVSQAQLTQAEKDFTEAWNDLMALVGPLGVKSIKKGTKATTVAASGDLVVEEPELLHVSKSGS